MTATTLSGSWPSCRLQAFACDDNSRIAETLDAAFVIVGSYTVDNGRIVAQAQVLEVNKLRLSPPLADSRS